MSYPLAIPSLRFAGLLTIWADANGIEYTHSVMGAGRRTRKPEPTTLPVILEFRSVADRAWLLEIARAKIAALRAAPSRGSKRGKRIALPRPEDVDRILADLEAAYRGIA
jgi:hypothetical protein